LVVTPDDEAADQSALHHLRRICFALPGVTETTLQDRPLFRVGRRRFALFNGATSPPRPRWASSGRSLHFLADPEEIDALRQDRRFVPSPHHGDRGWFSLRLDDPERPDWAEIAELLDAAHRQVARRLR
jgi:predicted DNA-binding protein (MmcQ/YjbR family)